MINIDPLVTYLIANTGNKFKKIENAYDIQLQIEDYSDDLPYLGVFPGADTASPEATDNLISNVSVFQTHLYLLCKLGEAVDLETTLHAALMGWSAGANYTDLELLSGDTNGLKNGVIWREYVYFNNIVIREAY